MNSETLREFWFDEDREDGFGYLPPTADGAGGPAPLGSRGLLLGHDD